MQIKGLFRNFGVKESYEKFFGFQIVSGVYPTVGLAIVNVEEGCFDMLSKLSHEFFDKSFDFDVFQNVYVIDLSLDFFFYGRLRHPRLFFTLFLCYLKKHNWLIFLVSIPTVVNFLSVWSFAYRMSRWCSNIIWVTEDRIFNFTYLFLLPIRCQHHLVLFRVRVAVVSTETHILEFFICWIVWKSLNHHIFVLVILHFRFVLFFIYLL